MRADAIDECWTLNPLCPHVISFFNAFLRADFNKSVVLEVGGLTTSQIDAKLEAAVKAGESMPRSRESEPYVLPAIVE